MAAREDEVRANWRLCRFFAWVMGWYHSLIPLTTLIIFTSYTFLNPDEPLTAAASLAESWPPREFTMRVVTEEVLAALEAPRCLLAIIDPGGFLCNALLPIDEVALQTPLVDVAARLQRPYVTAGRQDGLARELQRIMVAGVACTKAGDATSDGQTFRARALRSARDGEFDMPELAPVHAVDATLGDTIDQTAPFVVLYFSCCDPPDYPSSPRVTTSVRSSDGAATVIFDEVVGCSFPKPLLDLVHVLMDRAKRVRSLDTAATSTRRPTSPCYPLLSPRKRRSS